MGNQGKILWRGGTFKVFVPQFPAAGFVYQAKGEILFIPTHVMNFLTESLGGEDGDPSGSQVLLQGRIGNISYYSNHNALGFLSFKKFLLLKGKK